MFLFESIPWYCALMWFAVLGGLIVFNEVTRKNKFIAIIFFVVLPIILPFTLWKQTAGPDSCVGSWFHWAKVYSAVAGCLCFMALRYSKNLSQNKYVLAFPAIILAINIMEAVVRDFQCYNFNGIVNGVMTIGGPWNIMNGIAGILNILTISGFVGIVISKDKDKDMLWPDQLWFWIIAYDIWNFAYVYNCVSDHSFYGGTALLLACTISAFFIKKGAWLQHRAYTLAFWMMFAMSVPTFADSSIFAVKSSHNTTALFIVSALALAANVLVFVYHFYKIFKHKRNPITGEVHFDLDAYKEIVNEDEVVTTNN